MDRATHEDVIETIPDLIYAVDCEGRLLQWNRRLEETTGLSAEQLRGRSALEFFAVHDRERVAEAMAWAFQTGFAEVEADLIQADGTLQPYHYTGVPLRSEAGEIVGLTGVGRDIGKRRKAEKRNAALLDVVRDTTGTLDVAELLDRVQRRIAEVLPCKGVVVLYRFPSEDVFRTIAHHGLSPEEASQLEAVRWPLTGPFGGRIPRGECVLVDDASAFYPSVPRLKEVALLIAPLRVRGRHIGVLAVSREPGEPRFDPGDVGLCEAIAHQLALAMESTELYRAQQEEAQFSGALARVGQELIAAFGAPDLLDRLCKLTLEVLDCESSHTILFLEAEDAFAALAGYGYPPEIWESMRQLRLPRQWLGSGTDADATLPQQALTSEFDEPALRDVAVSLGIQSTLGMPLRRGTETIGFQAACYRSKPQRFSPLQMRIASGIAQLASLAFEHALTLEALERASRLKTEFVATMSHELRSPLNVILGYHGLLLEGAWGALTEEQRDVLGRADRSASELLELITETLDMSRLESGRVAVDLAEVALADVVGEVEGETRSHWDRPELNTVWEVADDIPLLYTDPLKLKVVLKNLVTNALKFTESGEVRLIAASTGDGVEITVSDTGIGISPDALKFIFDPFRQADSSSTRQHGGVGLGLYIVRRLLHLIGGSVAVESEVGRGSTFRVRLPLQP